jgi:hypothetical protein
MEYENRPIAFIAMRFGEYHWRDKMYLAIREELETAGYQVVRGDELKTSGPVVDEVCRLLKEAAFVVIDTSGDSHNVSYELGFCHGVGRDPAKTLLIRNDGDLPFNYRHYRHRVYKNIRHLRRLIRDYLDVSEPMQDDMVGYTFTFEFSENVTFDYIMDGAECVIDALLERELTCRCEIFSGERFETPGRIFTVGVAVRLRGRKNTPDYEFWSGCLDRVTDLASRFNGNIAHQRHLSEPNRKRAMKEWMLYCGAAELRDGQITKILDAEEEGNFFEVYLNRKEEHKTA